MLTTCLLLTAPLLSFAQVTAADDNAFITRLFRIQFDQHLSETRFLDVDPTADLTVEGCAEILRELRPGAAIVFALGHEGWARIPDAAFPAHPALSKDSLAIWRAACDRAGTPMYVYVSSLINYKLNHEHPEYARHFSNGGVAPQRLDHNAEFVDRLLIPFIETILERYHPEGIWFDGDFWSIYPSWNPASVELFERTTGLEAPLDFGHANFPEFWRFTTDSHADYVRRLAEVIHQHDPNCVFVVNGAYTLRQPSPPPPWIGRINIDPPLFFGMTACCLEARFQNGHGATPLDVVIGAYAEPEGSYYRYPKPPVQLAQEIATVLANGAYINVYVGLSRSGHIDTADVQTIRAVIDDFCPPRRAALQPSQSVADIAVLHTRDHFARSHRLDEVRGAALALLRQNRHFDIIDVETFVNVATDYRLAVVPEQGPLSPELAAALERFVHDGGGLLISLPSGIDGDGQPQTSLANLLPLSRVRRVDTAATLDSVHGPMGIEPGWFIVQPATTVRFEGDTFIRDGRAVESHAPGRLRYQVGRGHVVLFTAPVFRTFGGGADPRLKALIGDSLDWARGVEPPLQVSAPPWIEVVWRRSGNRDIVHLVNHARGAEPRPRSAAVDYVPVARDVAIKLRLPHQPEAVRLVPGELTPEYQWENGTLHVVVPQVAVHAALIVTRGGSVD